MYRMGFQIHNMLEEWIGEVMEGGMHKTDWRWVLEFDV